MNNCDFNSLKKDSKSFYKNADKELIEFCDHNIDEYVLGAVLNYIPSKNVYEIYCFIEDKKNIVSGLKNKLIKNAVLANLYYKYLKFCLEKRRLKFFFKAKGNKKETKR